MPVRPVVEPERPRLRIFRLLGLPVAIFVLAVLVRWPSTGESFWIDELHTAWTVSGEWSEVTSRAKSGNQNSFAFQALWLWTRLPWGPLANLYPLECIWRLPSVLATSIAAAWGAAFVQQLTGRTIAGIASGLVLALNLDAIFYGTELRPYSLVILLAVATCHCSWEVWHSERPAASWWASLLVVWVAMQCHVTSVLTLAWLIFIPAIKRRRELPVALSIVVFATAAAWEAWSIRDLWGKREQWQSFGNVDSLLDIGELWPWGSLLILPVVFWLVVDRPRWASFRGHPLQQWWIAIVVTMLISTGTFWCLAHLDIAALWHRRYAVGLLPLMAIAFGIVVAWISDRVGPKGSVALLVLAIGFWAVDHHRVLKKVVQTGVWVERDEHWREAIQWLNANAATGDRIWVDPGLIEQASLGPEVTDREMALYLSYCVDGPYRLRKDLQTVATGSRARRHWSTLGAADRWMLTRSSLPASMIAKTFGRIRIGEHRETTSP